MLWRAALFVCVAKCMVKADVILSPEFNDVLENSTLELTCQAYNVTVPTKWGTLNQTKTFLYLTFSKEGACKTDGLLADDLFFETKCYSNATFKVKIKRVNLTYHGQEWFCHQQYTQSNTAVITVQVPTKYVRFKNVSGNVLKTVEKVRTTLTCETSKGRPAANITWSKVSKKDVRTNIVYDKAYAITKKETRTERNMIIVRSSIHIEPVRKDNGTRFICEATNRKLFVVKKEITIHVQYPPSKPIFTVDKRKVSGIVQVISGKNMSVLCKSDSYPYPSYHWNSTGRRVYGEYLVLSTLDKSGAWQCTSTNSMSLSNETKISGKNSAQLEIQLLFSPSKPVLTWEGGGKHTVDETLYAIRNDDVTILCHSNGDPAPLYEWIEHSKGAQLHIADIQTNTSKTCKASNLMLETLGEVRFSSSSTAVSIIVSYPPGTPKLEFDGHSEVVENVTILRNKLIIKERSTFTITCKSDGFPPPVITWKNQDDRNSPYLTFTNITKDSIGVYTCYAENVIKRSFPAYWDKRTTSTDLEIDIIVK